LELKSAVFGKFTGQIEILNTHNLLCRQFAAVYWKVATSCPFPQFFNRWRRWWRECFEVNWIGASLGSLGAAASCVGRRRSIKSLAGRRATMTDHTLTTRSCTDQRPTDQSTDQWVTHLVSLLQWCRWINSYTDRAASAPSCIRSRRVSRLLGLRRYWDKFCWPRSGLIH